MKSRLALAVLALATVFSLIAVACSGPKPTPTSAPAAKPTAAPPAAKVSWKMYSYLAENHMVVKAWQRFADKVTTRTNGQLEIKVYPGGQLGYSATSLLQTIKSGELSIAETVTIQGESPISGLNNLPFLANNLEELKTLNDATLYLINRDFERFDAQVLISYPWASQHIFSNKPISKLDDFKGVKVRTYSPESALVVQLAGGAPVSMGINDVYAALQRGVVDAFITQNGAIKPYKFQEVIKYANQWGVATWCNYVVANRKALAALPLDVQKVLQDTAVETEKDFWVELAQYDKDSLAELPSLGVTVVNVPKEEVARLQKMAVESWDPWAKKTPIGEEGLAVARKVLNR